MAKIIYGDIKLIPSYHECIRGVGAERIYIEMIEPPPLEKVIGFQTDLIQKNGPCFSVP